jgi:hypothetical protein
MNTDVVYESFVDSLTEELLSYRHPISPISKEDIENMGWKLEKRKEEDFKYFANNYILGNKALVFFRVQGRGVDAMSWLLKVDGRIKQLVHTLGELERITNGE